MDFKHRLISAFFVGTFGLAPLCVLAESLSVLRADAATPIRVGIGQSLTYPSAFAFVEVTGSNPSAATTVPNSDHDVRIVGQSAGASTLFVIGSTHEFALADIVVGSEPGPTESVTPLSVTKATEVIAIADDTAQQSIGMHAKGAIVLVADFPVSAVQSSDQGVLYPVLLWPEGSEHRPREYPVYVLGLSEGTATLTLQTADGQRTVDVDVAP